MTATGFLSIALFHSMSRYVDWDFGIVNFDSECFIQLLNSAALLPMEEGEDDSEDPWGIAERMIAEGRQIIMNFNIASPMHYQWVQAAFGGDIVIKGLPVENRNGNILTTQCNIAMTTASENKEGVWEFIRFFLSDNWQRDYEFMSFPISKNIFNELMDGYMVEPEF